MNSTSFRVSIPGQPRPVILGTISAPILLACKATFLPGLFTLETMSTSLGMGARLELESVAGLTRNMQCITGKSS